MERIKLSNKTLVILFSFFLFIEIILVFFVFALNDKTLNKYISSFDLESYLKEESTYFLEDKKISEEIFSYLNNEKQMLLYDDLLENKIDANYIRENIIESIENYENQKDIKIYNYIREDIESLSFKAQIKLENAKNIIQYYKSTYIYLVTLLIIISLFILFLFFKILKEIAKIKYFIPGIILMIYSFMIYYINKKISENNQINIESLKLYDFKILLNRINYISERVYFILFIVGLTFLLISFLLIIRKIVRKIRIYLYDKNYGG